QRHGLKGFARQLGFLSGDQLLLDRIAALQKQRTGFIAALTSLGESEGGVVAESGQTFTAGRLGIAESPAFRAVGFDQQEQAVAVEELVITLAGLGTTALEIGERERFAGHRGTTSLSNRACTPKRTPKNGGFAWIKPEPNESIYSLKPRSRAVPWISVEVRGRYSGAGNRNRTCDLRVTSALLYLLSYSGGGA